MIPTSSSLLARLQSGSETQSWARFVTLYTPLLYAWIRRRGIAQEEAADLVQEVFSVLIQKLPRFRYDTNKSFAAWLRTITVNKCRDFFRRRNCRPAAPVSFIEPVVPDPVEDLSAAEYRAHLARRALELMQEEFQPATWKACWEVVVEGRSASEVAQELGVSVNAVYVAKSRVLRRLREELDGLWE